MRRATLRCRHWRRLFAIYAAATRVTPSLRCHAVTPFTWRGFHVDAAVVAAC